MTVPKRTKGSKKKPPKRQGPVRARLGTATARVWYVQGHIPPMDGLPAVENPSLAECAARIGCSTCRLEQLSAKEGWVKEREAWRKRVVEEMNTQTARELGANHMKFRAQVFATAATAVTQLRRTVTQNDLGVPDHKDLASALCNYQKAGDTAAIGPARPVRHVIPIEEPPVVTLSSSDNWTVIQRDLPTLSLTRLNAIDQEA